MYNIKAIPNAGNETAIPACMCVIDEGRWQYAPTFLVLNAML
jgi:hypothetical protein